MKYIALLTAIGLLFLAACATAAPNTAVKDTQSKKDHGFLVLSGSMVNREAYIDGVKAGVDPEDDSHYFKLKCGVHKLEIRNANRILMTDDIEIESGQNLSITVP